MIYPDAINRKTFSIILATYNCGQKVENTLRSILVQNKELFELIVVDGASTDETLGCIEKYKEHLTLVSEPDAGVYDAFNKGINLATGQYVYFIGAGDCLRPGALEQVKEFLPQSGLTLVYGDCYLVAEKRLKNVEFNIMLLVDGNLCHQSVFYSREIFDYFGKYELQYKVFADWIFNFRCFSDNSVVKLHIPCLIADFEGGGLSSGRNPDPAFSKHFPALVKQRLGFRLYLVAKALGIFPAAIYWIYRKNYAVRNRVSAIALSNDSQQTLPKKAQSNRSADSGA